MTTSWSTGLLKCLTSPNVGGKCCFAHCCCQPCVWASSLEHIQVDNAFLLGAFVCCGGRGLLDEFSGYIGRRAVVRKYDIRESELESGLVACVCGPCGRCQEVDTIVQRERLEYGWASVGKKASPPSPPVAPVQATMVRWKASSSRV